MPLTSPPKTGFCRLLPRRVLAGALALSLALGCLASHPPAAGADVRRADVILGQSVESRGLAVAQCPAIDAEYAVVMDGEGTVYFERNPDAPTQIASITKIMTALVALEEAPLDTPVTVSVRAAAVGESSASLLAGDTMTLETALKAMLLSSGNDAATAIAEDVGRVIAGDAALPGRDAEAVFIERMNTRAAELGCTDSVFTNPHGLDFDAWAGTMHSTAADVAAMSREAMKNETFRAIVAIPEDTIEVDRGGVSAPILLQSTDELLKNGFEGACGIKTGFTALAGQSFAAACNRGDGDLYAIVLDSSTEQQRFSDAETLLSWVYEHSVSYPLIHSDQTTIWDRGGVEEPVGVVARVAHSDWIDRTVAATLSDPQQAVEVFDLKGNISQEASFAEISGNISPGDKVGTITFKQRNETVAVADMVATEKVLAPDLFEGIGIWWDRLFRGFSNQPTVAENHLVNQTPRINNKSGD